jgi:hypothetical protein
MSRMWSDFQNMIQNLKKQLDLHHKLSISQNFKKHYVKIIKQYVYAKFMGFKV